MRMPILPVENDWEGPEKPGEGGSRGLYTREVRETLAKTGLRLC